VTELMTEEVFSAITTAAITSDERFARLAVAWIDRGLRELFPGIRAHLEHGPKPNRDALRDPTAAWGQPHSWWAGMITRPNPRANTRVALYSQPAWQKFIATVSKAPHSAELEIWKLDAAGRPGIAMARIGAHQFRWGPGWAEFSLSISRPLADWDASADLQNAWVDFLRQQVELQESSFGNIADDNISSKTALELTLGHSRIDTIPGSGQDLRGYSWPRSVARGSYSGWGVSIHCTAQARSRRWCR
jgi:hypothetical protein